MQQGEGDEEYAAENRWDETDHPPSTIGDQGNGPLLDSRGFFRRSMSFGPRDRLAASTDRAWT